MLLIIAAILTILLLLVVYFDVTEFIIPNWINFTILALYPIFLLVTPEPIEWWWSFVVFLGFFGIGILIFTLNIMGGGDVKLLIALSIWIGWQPESLLVFGFLVAISGGVLALLLIVGRLVLISIGSKMKKPPTFPKLLRWGEPLPYGVAIAYAFGYMLWQDRILGLIIS